mmetsp:Transcript_14885/g.35956  ORF Transcript_14885/g.35956 Transcript_14885/m.35956 type:complete len:338 (+) Transcript_14885:1918-2931(+)
MFHPSGPNLRRSWMTAWNVASANSSFLYGCGLLQESHCSSVMSLKVRFMLARTPLGGSLVSLMPFCSTSTGKISAGMELSHSRKSSCTGVDGCPMVSTSFSRESIQLLARWQLSRHVQSPLFCPAATSASATGPCPCPSEQMCSRSPGVQPFLVAKRCSMAVGSAPVDRMKMMGTRLLVSGNTSSSVHGGASVNALPSSTPTYCCADATTFSSLNTFTRLSLTNDDTLESQSPGRAASKGDSASAQALNSAEDAAMSAVSPPRVALRSCSRYATFFHTASLSQSTVLAGGSKLSGVPRRNTFHSRGSMVSLARKMDVQSRKENISLCSSKSPRQTLT